MATIIKFGFINGYGGTNTAWSRVKFCIDRKVHISVAESNYTAMDYDDSNHHTADWKVAGPCDGSCQNQGEFPPEVELLVADFLSTGQCGSFKTDVWE